MVCVCAVLPTVVCLFRTVKRGTSHINKIATEKQNARRGAVTAVSDVMVSTSSFLFFTLWAVMEPALSPGLRLTPAHLSFSY